MADLTLRLAKGSPLTNEEVDANFANLNEGQTIAGEPMGHEDKTQSVLSFDAGTRTVTIAPVGASFTVWCKGEKYEFTAAQTVVIPNTTGIHYIYFSSAGVLSAKLGYFDFHEDAPTAYVYWNAVTGTAPFFADERHGITLDWQTHEYLHRTRGAALANGFSISNYTTTGSGSLDSDAQFDLSGGTFFDEDLKVQIVATNTPTAGTWEQDLTGPAQVPVMYRSGAGWVRDNPTNFVLKAGTATPRYNTESGGVWGLTDVPNNSYSIVWVVATNNLTYPVVAIMGQAADGNSGNVEVLDWNDLNLDGFPAVEFRPLYKIIFQAKSTATNAIKAHFTNVFDVRNLVSAGPSAAIGSSHGGLSGLGNDDHVQYLHVSEVRNPSQAVKNSFLPAQTGNNGKFLTTDGSTPSWAMMTAPNNGTLTLSTSGSGLSGSGSFTADQAGNSTFTVTINSASANTADTIVLRDGSGNFSANVITANSFSGPLAGNASTASALATARAITATGDLSWTVSFDGSAAVSAAATLANSGVTAGTYGSATQTVTAVVDAKGRVTSLAQQTVTPAWSSITATPTTLAGYGITDAQALDADLTAIAALTGTSGFLTKTAANTWSLDTSTYLTGNQTITVSGDASGSGATSIALTLANSGVTAGTYTKVTVDAKGRVTTGASLSSGDVTTALGYTPYNSTNPNGYITSSALSGYQATLVSGTNIKTINGSSVLGSGDLTVSGTDPTKLPLSGGTLTGVITTPNGTHGIIIGDDSRLADRNIANTLFVEGSQNNDRGYINFGQTSGNALGAINAGDLTWRGSVVLHAGNYNSYALGIFGDTFTIADWNSLTAFGSRRTAPDGADANGPPINQYGNLLVFGHSSGVTQLQAGHDGRLAWRTKWNAADWTGWSVALDSGNYSSYAIPRNGSSWTPHPSTNRTADWNTFYTDYGYIQLGPANSSWAHIYSDKNFYFNNGIWIAGNRVLDAGNINSYIPSWSTGVNGNHIVQRDGSGYIYANHINFNTSESENPTINSFITSNGDGWSRKSSLAHVKNQIRGVADGTWGISVTGNANALGITGYGSGNLTYYQTSGNHQTWTGGWASHIIASHGDGATYYNQTLILPFWSAPQYMRKEGGTNVGPWVFLTTENYTSYSPSLTGSGASGTWGISVTGSSNSLNLSGHTISSSSWAGGGGYHGYQFNGGNWRFGFSSTGGVVDVYADGNFYATDSSHLVLHAGNFGSYALPLSGGTVSGIAYFLTNNGGYCGSTNSAKLQAYSTDNNSAFMSFHKAGHYAINMGLDADNVFRIGGWSASANRLQMDMSGNLTMAGNVTAYSDERLKKDWAAMPADFVSRLAQVKSGTYTRIDSDERQAGSSAQDWQELLPEVVHVGGDEDKTLGLAYGNAALVSAIELAKDNVELRARIERLESLIATLIGDQK